MLYRWIRLFYARHATQRIDALEMELREANSTIDVLTLERDQLLAVCERERQRVAAETKIQVARGTRATGESAKQQP